MHILTGYQFTHLTNLKTLQTTLRTKGQALGLRGTILLSPEGINLTVMGQRSACEALSRQLQAEPLLNNLMLRLYPTDRSAFKKFKVNIRAEMIQIGQMMSSPANISTISPKQLANWYQKKQSFQILDVRNDYEVAHGTFKSAQHLNIKTFKAFPTALTQQCKPSSTDTVIVCTGGIRCVKAAAVMQQAGFSNVHMLTGGILHYFQEQQQDYYQGHCFVFDDRMVIDANFQTVDLPAQDTGVKNL